MAKGSHGEPCCFSLLACRHVEATMETFLLQNTTHLDLSP